MSKETYYIAWQTAMRDLADAKDRIAELDVNNKSLSADLLQALDDLRYIDGIALRGNKNIRFSESIRENILGYVQSLERLWLR